MSGPLIFVSHSRVKPGKREQYVSHVRAANELVESEEPRMIGFNSYASDDSAEVSTVQIHPDVDSLETHLKIFTEKLQAQAFDAVESSEVNVYGEAGEKVQGMLTTLADQMGIRIRVLPVHHGGFLRPQPQ